MARPPKDINEKLLVEKYLNGATSRELAKEFSLCQQTVLNRIHKYVDISIEVKKIKKNSLV